MLDEEKTIYEADIPEVDIVHHRLVIIPKKNAVLIVKQLGRNTKELSAKAAVIKEMLILSSKCSV